MKKPLTELDEFAISIIKIICRHAKYAVVSGYVAILLGRSRVSEDIDLFIEEISFKKFKQLFSDLEKNEFWFVNGDDATELYSILKDNSSIRIAVHGRGVPNVEIKFPSEETDFYSLNNTFRIILGKNEIIAGSLELNIAYKLRLGSQKDIEDAIHMFEVSKEHLNMETLSYFIKKLKMENRAAEHLLKK